MSEIDLEEERRRSKERRELEHDRNLAIRIARKVYPVGPNDENRRIMDAMALMPIGSLDSPRIDRLRKLASEEILQLHRDHRRVKGKPKKKRRRKEKTVQTNPTDPLALAVTSIPGLPGAASNRLWSAGIKTVGQLVERTEEELLEIKYVSTSAMKAIREYLFEHDLRLREAGVDPVQGSTHTEGVDESEPDPEEVVHPELEPEDFDDPGPPTGGRDLADPGPDPELEEGDIDVTSELGLKAPDRVVLKKGVVIDPKEDPRKEPGKDGPQPGPNIIELRRSLPEYDELELSGPWGILSMRKLEGGQVEVSMVGTFQLRSADELAAVVFREKYGFTVIPPRFELTPSDSSVQNPGTTPFHVSLDPGARS